MADATLSKTTQAWPRSLYVLAATTSITLPNCEQTATKDFLSSAGGQEMRGSGGEHVEVGGLERSWRRERGGGEGILRGWKMARVPTGGRMPRVRGIDRGGVRRAPSFLIFSLRLFT